MKVYLIRHAQSAENALDKRQRVSAGDFGLMIGQSPEAPLTDEGQRQARLLIERLNSARLAYLYCSPYARALTTARILGEAFDLTPEIIPDLREILPRVSGIRRPQRSLRWHYIQSYVEMLWPWGEQETWSHGYQRATRAWRQVIARPADEVAVVAHRGTNALIMMAMLLDRNWRVVRSDLSNGGVSIIVSNGQRRRAAQP